MRISKLIIGALVFTTLFFKIALNTIPYESHRLMLAHHGVHHHEYINHYEMPEILLLNIPLKNSFYNNLPLTVNHRFIQLKSIILDTHEKPPSLLFLI